MSEKVMFAKEDLETAVYRLVTLRGLLGMLRYSGQTPSEVSGEDLEGAILSIDYIIGDVEDNIRDVIAKMNGWQREELRRGRSHEYGKDHRHTGTGKTGDSGQRQTPVGNSD